jgi:hypothetical protein
MALLTGTGHKATKRKTCCAELGLVSSHDGRSLEMSKNTERKGTMQGKEAGSPICSSVKPDRLWLLVTRKKCEEGCVQGQRFLKWK